MNDKRKTGVNPSTSTLGRMPELQTHKSGANRLEDYSPAALLPAMRPRRFHIGWVPNKVFPLPPETPAPRVYLIEGEREYLLRAVMSGGHQTELEVVVSGDSVHIRGRARRKEREQRVGQDFPETFSELFFRTVELPGEINCAEATAEFDDDVLEMKLPKVALVG